VRRRAIQGGISEPQQLLKVLIRNSGNDPPGRLGMWNIGNGVPVHVPFRDAPVEETLDVAVVGLVIGVADELPGPIPLAEPLGMRVQTGQILPHLGLADIAEGGPLHSFGEVHHPAQSTALVFNHAGRTVADFQVQEEVFDGLAKKKVEVTNLLDGHNFVATRRYYTAM
jgi:hypothetical protein